MPHMNFKCRKNKAWMKFLIAKMRSLSPVTEYRIRCMMRNKLKYFLTLMWFGSFMPGWVSAEVIIGEEEQTGLGTWEWGEAGVSVQLVQRLPDQTRAFFQGRGFSSAEADSIARTCVFQTIFRNDGKEPLVYDLDDWRVTYQGKQRPLLTRERWDAKWQDSGVSPPARIALRWSLLPTRQDFEPGDYIWGMISFGLPLGESFDLSLMLTIDGNIITSSIPGIICTADLPGN